MNGGTPKSWMVYSGKSMKIYQTNDDLGVVNMFQHVSTRKPYESVVISIPNNIWKKM